MFAYQSMYFFGYVELYELLMPFIACAVSLLFCGSFDSLAVLLGYAISSMCFFTLVTPIANFFSCLVEITVLYIFVLVRMFWFEKRIMCEGRC